MYRGDGTNVFLKDAPSLVFTTLGMINYRLLLRLADELNSLQHLKTFFLLFHL